MNTDYIVVGVILATVVLLVILSLVLHRRYKNKEHSFADLDERERKAIEEQRLKDQRRFDAEHPDNENQLGPPSGPVEAWNGNQYAGPLSVDAISPPNVIYADGLGPLGPQAGDHAMMPGLNGPGSHHHSDGLRDNSGQQPHGGDMGASSEGDNGPGGRKRRKQPFDRASFSGDDVGAGASDGQRNVPGQNGSKADGRSGGKNREAPKETDWRNLYKWVTDGKMHNIKDVHNILFK